MILNIYKIKQNNIETKGHETSYRVLQATTRLQLQLQRSYTKKRTKTVVWE